MKRPQALPLLALLILFALPLSWLCRARAQEPTGRPADLPSAPQSIPASQFKPAEVLVKFQADAPSSSLESVPGQYGASRLRSLFGLDVELWQVPAGQELDIVARLNADPLVEYAEPNYLYYAVSTPNDPSFARQWAHTKMESAAAWDISTGTIGTTVAVVDTGIDETHPDLAAKIVAGYDFVDNDASPHDLNGHGTHVAGIAGAVTDNGVGVAGMDWQARIMPVRVLNDEGAGYDSWVTSGIVWAYQHGAKVINLSLGGPSYSQTMQTAINNAHAAGSLVVAAMGNDGSSTPAYPAAYANVFAVAATTKLDTAAYYSNYGSHCDIAAPGGEMGYLHDPNGIYSTLPTYPVYMTIYEGFSQSYDYVPGTSMAAPYVSGLASLVWSVNSMMTPDQVQTTIENAAVDLGSPGWDSHFGHGRIDALAALLAAAPAPAAPTLYAISNPDGDGNYVVDWSDVAGATGYTLQEDDNAGFSSPTVRYAGTAAQFSVANQGGGTWYYRVGASNEAGDSPWSGTQSVTVKPAAPTLSLTGGQDAYQLSWSAPAGAFSYTLQEDDNSSFSSPAVRYQGILLQYAVSGQPNGTWYYRAIASNSAGDSPPSNTQSVTVNYATLPAPTLYVIGNPDGDGSYQVDWSDVAGATAYSLDQSRSPYFEAPAEVYSGSYSQFSVTDQPGGTWYYRVRASGPAGQSPWSNQRSVAVGSRVYLPLLARDLEPGGGAGLSITEGFDLGVVPPVGWTLFQTNPRDTWKKMVGTLPFEGPYSADCDWDLQGGFQNEVLLSPEFQATSALLQFHSFGSIQWCRYPTDNCDLNVWLVVGGWDGGLEAVDDIPVYTVDQDWVGELVWSPSTIDLTPYLPAGTLVRVGFQYLGQDGEQIGLDAIQITGR